MTNLKFNSWFSGQLPEKKLNYIYFAWIQLDIRYVYTKLENFYTFRQVWFVRIDDASLNSHKYKIVETLNKVALNESSLNKNLNRSLKFC